MQDLEYLRQFLKCNVAKKQPGTKTDREKGLPAPPLQKPNLTQAGVIELEKPGSFPLKPISLVEAIASRKSRRKYSDRRLTPGEISFLLWATQGVKKIVTSAGHAATRRTVPSGGSCHAFETYVLVNRVEAMECGLYRYLPLDHALCFLYQDAELVEKAHEACLGQYVSGCAAAFFWTVIPYRAEWRYGEICHKILAVDAGHVCQNLYLACEAINAGTCAIGAYHQGKLDRLLKVDGNDEFAIYAATVGKVI